MKFSLFLPETDRAEFCKLPAKVQAEFHLWLEVIEAILAEENKAAAIRAQTYRMKGARGFSRANIIRKYYQVYKGADWRCLVNHAKIGRKK